MGINRLLTPGSIIPTLESQLYTSQTGTQAGQDSKALLLCILCILCVIVMLYIYKLIVF